MLASLTSREISEWIAFYGIEPFGEEREDLRAAMIAVEIHNAQCTKRSQLIGIKDRLLTFDPPKQQSVDEMKTILNGLCHG